MAEYLFYHKFVPHDILYIKRNSCGENTPVNMEWWSFNIWTVDKYRSSSKSTIINYALSSMPMYYLYEA